MYYSPSPENHTESTLFLQKKPDARFHVPLNKHMLTHTALIL